LVLPGDRLWLGEMIYYGNKKPYERQTSEHKRKIIAEIKKRMTEIAAGELGTLTFKWPKLE